jgi:predicted ABC-type ATPase/EAL domain-containing protein (putative c-di-GMP-specific phosphodiesterase class I)
VRLELQTVLAELLSNRQPCIVVLAGSNGAGKSTFFREFLEPTGIIFVNADVMARAMNPAAPGDVGYQAARVAEATRQDLVSRGQSFCMETVLSDPAGDKVAFLRAAQSKGYVICLIYIRLASVELSRARVQQRVSEGGHDVPDDKLDSRFERTRRNAASALSIADVGFVFDNSSVEHPYRHLETWIAGACVDPEQPPASAGSAVPVDSTKIPAATVTFLSEKVREQARRRELEKSQFIERSIQSGVVGFVRRPVVELRANPKGFQYEFSPQLIAPDGSMVDLSTIVGTGLHRSALATIERTTIELALQSLHTHADLSALQFAMFNLSVTTVTDPTFVEWFIATAAKHRIPNGLLCVQCREQEILEALEALTPMASRLQQAGCRFSISHFGSGHNTVGYLKQFPSAFLNVDSGFAQDVAIEQTDRDLVKAIVNLGHALRHLVIADGIKDPSAYEILRSLDVDYLIPVQFIG